jgi:hypothetical protein
VLEELQLPSYEVTAVPLIGLRTPRMSVAAYEAHTKRFGIVQLPEKALYACCQQIVMLAHHATWHSTNRDST